MGPGPLGPGAWASLVLPAAEPPREDGLAGVSHCTVPLPPSLTSLHRGLTTGRCPGSTQQEKLVCSVQFWAPRGLPRSWRGCPILSWLREVVSRPSLISPCYPRVSF